MVATTPMRTLLYLGAALSVPRGTTGQAARTCPALPGVPPQEAAKPGTFPDAIVWDQMSVNVMRMDAPGQGAAAYEMSLSNLCTPSPHAGNFSASFFEWVKGDSKGDWIANFTAGNSTREVEAVTDADVNGTCAACADGSNATLANSSGKLTCSCTATVFIMPTQLTTSGTCNLTGIALTPDHDVPRLRLQFDSCSKSVSVPLRKAAGGTKLVDWVCKVSEPEKMCEELDIEYNKSDVMLDLSGLQMPGGANTVTMMSIKPVATDCFEPFDWYMIDNALAVDETQWDALVKIRDSLAGFLPVVSSVQATAVVDRLCLVDCDGNLAGECNPEVEPVCGVTCWWRVFLTVLFLALLFFCLGMCLALCLRFCCGPRGVKMKGVNVKERFPPTGAESTTNFSPDGFQGWGGDGDASRGRGCSCM